MKYNMSLGLLDYYCGHNTMGRKKIPDNIPELSTSEWKSLIDEWIFSARNREIMKLYLIDDISIEKISEKYKLSARRTQVIVSAENKRDSMGRYSGDAAMDELRTMMNEERDETKRRKIQSIIQSLE